MTREEAVDYIKEWLKDEYALNSKDRIVLTMAIEALQAQEWIPVEKSLPNEDEIPYTTVVDISDIARSHSDRVLAKDEYGYVVAGYFVCTGTTHKYEGRCIRPIPKYAPTCSKAGWEFMDYYNHNKSQWKCPVPNFYPVAWKPMPE